MSDKTEDEKVLNRKNTSAIEQALAALIARVYEQQIKIDALQSTINSSMERMSALERILIVQKMATMGHGPSVK